MITIEKFYFDFDEVTLSGAADGIDYKISVVASDEDPIGIDLRVRGKKNFRKFLQEFNDIGMGLIGDEDA